MLRKYGFEIVQGDTIDVLSEKRKIDTTEPHPHHSDARIVYSGNWCFTLFDTSYWRKLNDGSYCDSPQWWSHPDRPNDLSAMSKQTVLDIING